VVAASLLAMIGCSADESVANDGGSDGAGSDAARDGRASDAAARDGSASDRPALDGGSAASNDAAAGDEREPFMELPRLAADPGLTRRLLSGPISLIGGGVSGCSHGETTERWCGFSRPSTTEAGSASELWVINVSKALAGGAVSCDRDGPDCFRLTSKLFTGSQLWGVYFPYADRFEGDTLIFYADAPDDVPDPYVGPVFAWRPGWTKARQLTSAGGGQCFAPHRAAVAFCTESVVAQQNPDQLVPNVRALDLLAGPIDDPSGGPLPKVDQLAADGPARLEARARFSARGEYFAYSYFSEAREQETVKIIGTVAAGRVAPSSGPLNAAQWEISHDATKIYYLQGVDRKLGELAEGTLMMADFPSGDSVTALRANVASFELLGAREEVFSDLDRGVAFYTLGPQDSWTFSLMSDRSRPGDVQQIGRQPEGAEVATDGRHAVYRESQDEDSYASHADGTSTCRLTIDRRAETYGTHFTDSGQRVTWIEYNRDDSGSEEGWYARPEDCSQKTKFGDYVTSYSLVGDDFVLFNGGDVEDRTTWLQFTPLGKEPTMTPLLPTIIVENPSTSARIGSGESTFVLYTLSSPGDAGLYAFGPLPLSRPQ
jgi:hypothetical protein